MQSRDWYDVSCSYLTDIHADLIPYKKTLIQKYSTKLPLLCLPIHTLLLIPYLHHHKSGHSVSLHSYTSIAPVTLSWQATLEYNRALAHYLSNHVDCHFQRIFTVHLAAMIAHPVFVGVFWGRRGDVVWFCGWLFVLIWLQVLGALFSGLVGLFLFGCLVGFVLN